MLEGIQRRMQGEGSQAPVAELIGFRLAAIGDGHATVELEAGKQHANPMGTLHGGILCDIADAAMGMAYASTLGDGESFTTLELKINFLKPIWNARLTAKPTWSGTGGRSAWWNAMYSTRSEAWWRELVARA